MRRFSLFRSPCLWTALLLPALLGAQSAKEIDFRTEIRPILSDACFHCHGPDANSRMAGLRLDTRDGAFAERRSGRPIVPGQPQASLILQRIEHANPALRMPPASAHKVLSAAQIATLKTWIQQGAPWREHWAFTAPVKAAPPAVKKADWVRNPIDAFVLSRLEAAGLSPAPEADRRTLARRVSLDLTGLPPTPAEVNAFVADTAPDAYERLVDRLLASPRYGEHRARYWLDAARYADTHGIHVDNYREMWPYRDWVIRAFNSNMPFSQFTEEQIAGDLMPNRTLDQQIASGFHRCGISTNEAGVIVEEVEAIYAKDRVDTTGTVFLGMTLGCASCHDHKFDPIPQRDFYSMAAFFRNTTQDAMDGNIPDTPPIVVVPQPADRARWKAIHQERRGLEAKKEERRQSPPKDLGRWIHSGQRAATATPLEPSAEVLSLWTSKPEVLDGAELSSGPAAGRQAYKFPKSGYLSLPNQPVFEAGRPFSIAAEFFFPEGEDSFAVASQNDPDRKSHGWLLEISARVANFRLVGDDGKAITIRAGHMEQMKPGTWNHLVVSYDGSRVQAGLSLYLNGRVIPIQGGGDQNTRLSGSISPGTPLLLGRENKRGLVGGAISEFAIFNRVLTAEEARIVFDWPILRASRQKPAAKLTEAERTAWSLAYLSLRDKDYRELSSRLAALDAESRQIRERGAVTLVMEERKDRQPVANILYRGMYDQPRDEVRPATPSALPPMNPAWPRNRLGLAKWLVDDANPLTSRVTVNRFWQEIFGAGLVRTAEDFGSQGIAPSHPELLDWLSVDYRESGWDTKRLLRQMVLSSTYRQMASVTPDKLKADPENRLLSRGPRFRMDGEVLRDVALSVSGLLDSRIGGPSVKPYQPEGVWEAVAMLGSNTRHYQQGGGADLYRRSLYTFWKRSAPPASMEIFNAPTREQCTVRRERTNTPLQALTTLNDPQFVEAARKLAETIVTAGGRFEEQADALGLRVLARPFAPPEREILRREFADLQTHYERNPADAKKLLAVGEAPLNATLPAPDLAAWTMLANSVLNLDEALNK